MIKINDIEYKLKYTIRALFIYEKITGKPFKFEGLYSEYILFFCVLVANNESFKLTFDEFVNYCDDNPKLFLDFRIWLLKELELQSLYVEEKDKNTDTETDNSKKKN